ncbi:hypothetical protein EJ06DRAFT_529933, partial [Trichodelitschia bisporula]
MLLDNDTRGWIMSVLSGVANMIGASFICVDIVARWIRPSSTFRIQDSDPFLSSALSLSFGVMLFLALYSMLPKARSSLQQGGFSPSASAWILIALFLVGALGIQVASRVLHRFIPTHIVDCEHTHEDEENGFPHLPDHPPHMPRRRSSHIQKAYGTNGQSHAETQPLLAETREREDLKPIRRPTLKETVSQLVLNTKICDDNGRCYGFTDPCGAECFKIVNRASLRPLSHMHQKAAMPSEHLLPHVGEEATTLTQLDGPFSDSETNTSARSPHRARSSHSHHSHHSHNSHANHSHHSHDHNHAASHHHHVPENAFLSIGLQTSLAIALHKIPEGFITYATNHVNPRLGVSVFLTLFIHNITEGFAMALPLYLAFNSRPKAMLWSTLLGGLTQPLGAGIAAIWLGGKYGDGGAGPVGEAVYGSLFAVVAGIMASVALQLFSESLERTHNRNLCMTFAFVGMGILGMSSAMTAS